VSATGEWSSVEDAVEVGAARRAAAEPSSDVGSADAPAAELIALTEALEGADDLPLDDRLDLLRRTESAISRSLEGLDGL